MEDAEAVVDEDAAETSEDDQAVDGETSDDDSASDESDGEATEEASD